MSKRFAIVAAALAILSSGDVAAALTRRRPPHPPAPEAQSKVAPDDLYRRRGYGTGGLLFGNTAQAGACADLAFARPGGCGPRGGYGVYGNGLGYGF